MDPVIKAVRDYATEHYEQDGWDFVVETMDDADIREKIGPTSRPDTAISRMRRYVKRINSYRDDIQREAF
jgi:hypothetical protein